MMVGSYAVKVKKDIGAFNTPAVVAPVFFHHGFQDNSM